MTILFFVFVLPAFVLLMLVVLAVHAIVSMRDLRRARRERYMRMWRLEERIARDKGVSVQALRAQFDAEFRERLRSPFIRFIRQRFMGC